MYEQETLSEQVYQRLLDEIKGGTWDVGEHLNEKKIAEALHVSRTPVRWALRRINDSGLLEYDKNHGYRVRLLTASDVRGIFKIRGALETLAVKEAALKMTDDDRVRLEETIDQEVNANKEKDVDTMLDASADFDEICFQVARMPRMIQIQKEMASVLYSFRKIALNMAASRRELSVEHHQKILEAMLRQDLDEIEKRIRLHLERAESYVLQVLEDGPRPENTKRPEDIEPIL